MNWGWSKKARLLISSCTGLIPFPSYRKAISFSSSSMRNVAPLLRRVSWKGGRSSPPAGSPASTRPQLFPRRENEFERLRPQYDEAEKSAARMLPALKRIQARCARHPIDAQTSPSEARVSIFSMTGIRLGMLTPSSNTVLEPVTMAMLAGLTDVSAHFSRFRVMQIGLSEKDRDQFSRAEMIRAAELLADANVDVIAWNGTSASWLGFEHDEQLCAEIEGLTNIAGCTSVLAFRDIFTRTGARKDRAGHALRRRCPAKYCKKLGRCRFRLCCGAPSWPERKFFVRKGGGIHD